MRVYIVTDLEGASGVTLWSQTTPNPDAAAYERSRRLLMSDINAAVEGCLDGGATRVTVLDGHGYPCNVVPELMHPAAEYVCGSGLPRGWGLEEGYDCAMQVGCHAMNRTMDGVLYHTQSHLSDARYWYNDRECGEIGQCGLVFGHFNLPVVMVTGDFAACREATDFFGPGCVTVPVKYGYGRQCCRMLAPEKTAALIREGAREALTRVGQVAPFKLELPIRARVETVVGEMPETATAADFEAAPHQTHEGTCATQLDIYGF
jgi:D-amino peptidase